jgi:peptidylprolyl isomerase
VGGTDKEPTLTVKTMPLTVKETTTKVVVDGKGATLTKADSIKFKYVIHNGKDGKLFESNFTKPAVNWDLSTTQQMAGLSKGLVGQHVGSRVLLALPPADGFGPEGNPQAGFWPHRHPRLPCRGDLREHAPEDRYW